MLRESRKVARTFRTTLRHFTRLQGTANQLSGSSHSFANACRAVAACDSRDFGATFGSPFYKQNAAYQLYGSSQCSHAACNGFGALVCRASGQSLKDVDRTIAKSAAQGGSSTCRSLVEESCMDHQVLTPTFKRFHDCAPVLAASIYSKNYSTQPRHLSSATDKPVRTNEKKDDNKSDQTSEKRSLGAKLKSLLSDLENVPVPALGLGLAGAIPFVGLAPGIASILPLPDCLYDVHVQAQAAYGAVILTFLGGPHWGLAMSDNGVSPKSGFSKMSVRTLRYVWSVIPSLVAWPALLLAPVPKLTVLITSYGLVLGVDALFTRMGLLPSWFLPLRILLTSIAMLSMTSSLVVTAAVNASAAVTH